MTNNEHCKIVTAKLLSLSSRHRDANTRPSIVDYNYFNEDGDYTSFTALIRIPYERGNGKGIGHTEAVYDFFVRRLGSSSGAYVIKTLLRAPDEFMGRGDFDWRPSSARYAFEEDMRCSADVIKQNGKIVCWKSLTA